MVAVVTSLRHRPKVATSTPSFDVDTGVVAVARRAMSARSWGWLLELFAPALHEEDEVSRMGLVHARAEGNLWRVPRAPVRDLGYPTHRQGPPARLRIR